MLRRAQLVRSTKARKLLVPGAVRRRSPRHCSRSASPTSTAASASRRSRFFGDRPVHFPVPARAAAALRAARRGAGAAGQAAHERTKQLATLQVGVLSALLRTLDLRDRMTARHCAAVARYAREIAIAAGFSKEEQDLVHTAGLLHDIGKFIFPDRILKGDTKLTDDDWKIIKMHPYQGARVVAQMEGYGPVSEIILAHHERIDGKGYPARPAGRRDPGAVAHHLGRGHLRRDDRARLLPHADLLVRGDPGAAARRRARSSTPSIVELFIAHPGRQGRPLPPRRGRRLRRRAGLDKRVDEYALPVDRSRGNGDAPTSPRSPAGRRRRGEAAEQAPAGRTAARLSDELAGVRRAACGAPARAGTMLTHIPVPSSKPGQRASAAARRRRASGSARRRAGAVRTQRFSGGGAPSRVAQARQALAQQVERSRLVGSAKLRLVPARHELQLVGPARGDRAPAAPRGRRRRPRARGGAPPPGAGRTAGSRPSCGCCAR